MFFRHWTEARGFSGFSDDNDLSGCYLLTDPSVSDTEIALYAPHALKPDGTRKTFVHPRTLLSMQHPYSKGYPIYENEAYNLLMLGSRDTGKTYMVGIGVVLHQWLFNGLTDLQPTPEGVKRQVADLTVGAELAHYSSNMLVKTKFALENLPGGKTINGRRYPSPFYEAYKGSWSAGSMITAENKVKVSGGWELIGSGATIRHRTFRDNPFAEQGTRPIAIIVEEAGHCLGENTPVRLADLSTKMSQDIAVGDLLLGPDGKQRTVEAIVSGIAPMYKVSQKYGDDYIVSKGHTLYLEQRTSHKSFKDDGPKKILVEDFSREKLGSYKFRTTYGVKNSRLDFNQIFIPSLDPYYLGLWLGDGTKGKPEITLNPSKDYEVLDYLKSLAKILDLRFIQSKYKVNLSGTNGLVNPLVQALRDLEVLNNKHIPDVCQFYSVKDRLKLLAGLLDSDGNLSGKNSTRQSFE